MNPGVAASRRQVFHPRRRRAALATALVGAVSLAPGCRGTELHRAFDTDLPRPFASQSAFTRGAFRLGQVVGFGAGVAAAPATVAGGTLLTLSGEFGLFVGFLTSLELSYAVGLLTASPALIIENTLGLPLKAVQRLRARATERTPPPAPKRPRVVPGSDGQAPPPAQGRAGCGRPVCPIHGPAPAPGPVRGPQLRLQAGAIEIVVPEQVPEPELPRELGEELHELLPGR